MNVRLVDKSGRNYFIFECNVYFPGIIEKAKAWCVRTYRRIMFRRSQGGKYVCRDGALVRVGRARIRDFWFEKWRINGDRDAFNCYKSLEKRGRLKEVDDREVYEPLLRNKNAYS